MKLTTMAAQLNRRIHPGSLLLMIVLGIVLASNSTIKSQLTHLAFVFAAYSFWIVLIGWYYVKPYLTEQTFIYGALYLVAGVVIWSFYHRLMAWRLDRKIARTISEIERYLGNDDATPRRE